MKYLRPFAVIAPVTGYRPYRALPYLGLGLALLVTGCSQERDAFLNRTFHRLTARDNGWFNANEKLNEIVTGIEDRHVDDYDHVLPLFVYGTADEARSAIPELEKCIDKCSLVIERHSMDIEGKEKNTWIDDAYFVIAKSHFYKRNFYEAERGFTYIGRRFKGENKQLESKVWLARTAIELEQYGKAQSALDEVLDEKELPKRFDHGELSAVLAELNLKRGKVDDAIVHLERAVSLAETKRERVRWAFILAQLYAVKGHEEKAIKQYAAVVKMGPPYEMAFHAQIFQALAHNKGNSKALRQKLNRMLRDDKHVDHFDMIHYALADLDLKERKDSLAIVHLETSARVSTTDTKQKAKTFLKLADIYFDDRIYASAQKYYDSTRTILSEEHERYQEVDTRARVLGDLVEQLEIIALEDSLQALAQLDEGELEKRIRGMIRDREQAEAEKERLEQEARERLANDPDAGKPPIATGGGGRGNWYFYDPQQIGRGLTQFRKRWGNRPLEDDWRRKDKSGSALADQVEEEGEAALAELEAEKEKGEEAWKDPAFYTKDLPRDAAALEASNARVCSALYVSGMIYKEQLKDADNAIESFEVLNGRFDECRYTPESYYQLYRIYLEKEQTTNYFPSDGRGSAYYAETILERWPDSEFARLVRDPNILQADEERRLAEEAAYKEVYERYRQYLYNSVIISCNGVIDNEPRNHFLAKYHMLRAMAIGGMRDANGFREALTAITVQFPGTDEAAAAAALLEALGGSAQNTPPPLPAKPGFNSSGYKLAPGTHSFAMIIPNEGNDLNTVRETVANFNTQYLPNTRLEVTNTFLDPEHQVMLVSVFPSKEKAMEYYTLFMANSDLLVTINDQGFPAFAISTDNYTQFYRNKDVEAYTAFFTQNYLDRQ
ncbi:MAG: tetratricopeptide repeat protein [Flavobacteriales bacterium]|nr:tetratricopeptide repeat protein [Flavobacteriales bacterium]